MTTPSGRPGFNVIDRFAITGDDGSVPDLVHRTEEVIKGVLKERIRSSPGWNGSTADVWAQLRRGIPLDHALLEVIVNRLTGGLVVFPTKQEAIMALKKVPFLDDLVEFLTGIEDGDENDLGTFFLNLRRFFQSIDFTDPDFDPAVVHKAFVEIVVQPFIKTITEITSALLGPLSIGFLTDEIQTLLFEGGFDDPATIIPGDGVEHDATDGVPLTTPLGCAKVTCDGTHKSRASAVIKVAPGWVLKLGGRIKYEGLTAGTNAIRLNLIPYSNATTPVPGGAIMVATAGTVSGTSTGVNGWRILPIEGTWTVPATGVSHVVVEWHVTDAATAGVVKFDELYLQSTEKIPQSFTKDLPEDLTSLFNWIGSLVDQMLTALGITPVGSLLDRIFDLSDELEWIQNKAQEVGDEIADGWNKFWGRIFGNPNATGKTVDDFAEATQVIVDYVRQGADGTGQTDGQMSDAKSAVDGLRQTLAGLQAKVTQILARDPHAGGAPGVVGNVATDDAEREAGIGWGPGWIVPAGFNTNGIRTDGHRWVWSDSGNSARTTPGIYTAMSTLTPYQSVQIVMASLMEQPGWGGPGDPNNWIIFRSNVTGTQFAFVAVHYNRVELWKYDSGTYSKIGPDFEVTPAVGARWELRAGTVVSVDNLVLLMNDRGVANWTPGPGVVWSDTAHVWAGQGMQSDNRNAGEATPGSIEVWTLSDNPPTGTIGSGLIVSSTATTNVPMSSGTSRIPSGFFNVYEQGSADIAWDGQKAIVRDAGWYAVQLELVVPTGAAGATGVLYRQGTPWKLRRSASPLGGLGSIGGSWNIYLPAGGECGPGLNAPSTSPAITSDAAGQTSWFSITKANP
ncbi:DUF7257 domain-containing protein [Mycolicibacterium fortuitum]|uniref:DUF7257 domain-containing protein n=1 Tax=Mycolicibacterium fortuitum TaxID=1766 RepID=UPI0011328E4E|nr:hypothetical protein [Mycolicibacterium fortuitum]TPW93648.1 hypothetical protein FKW78_18475 [Mycolicibacterium fortuitum]